MHNIKSSSVQDIMEGIFTRDMEGNDLPFASYAFSTIFVLQYNIILCRFKRDIKQEEFFANKLCRITKDMDGASHSFFSHLYFCINFRNLKYSEGEVLEQSFLVYAERKTNPAKWWLVPWRICTPILIKLIEASFYRLANLRYPLLI